MLIKMVLYLLLYLGTSYKSVVQTIDSGGNELFKKYLSMANVIDTSISNDNKYLAMAEANFSGILIQSTVEIISIEEAQINSSESIKYTHMAEASDLIIDIEYNNRDELICMYDNHIDSLNGDQNTELVNFNNEEVLFADISFTSNFVEVVKKPEGVLNSYIEIQIIDSSNTQSKNIYELEDTPRQLYTYGNMFAVNLGMNVLFINHNGWLVKKYQSNQEEVQNIVMSEEIAGIISKNKVKIISL